MPPEPPKKKPHQFDLGNPDFGVLPSCAPFGLKGKISKSSEMHVLYIIRTEIRCETKKSVRSALKKLFLRR